MTVRTFRRIAAALVLLLPTLAACAVAPATGRSIFTGGLTPEKEAKLGFQENKKVLKEFGGPYDDPELARYVSSLGKLLARTSEMPDLEFTFTVLDSPIVNAFALPAGYVYITRGLLALADSEAELAGVLAHEIGHVTARHTAERYGQTMLAQGATLGAGLLLGGSASDLTGAGAMLFVRSWSRDQEHEADLLGVRYLSRVGYRPQAMASFLTRLQAQSRLDAEIAGSPGKADEFSLLQTHPRTADRIEVAIRAAGTKPVANPMVARETYLRKIDGLLYGDDPKQGVIKGRRFLHSDLRFAFEVPEGFRLINSPSKVAARGPEGAAIVFDMAPKAAGASMTDYLVRDWATDTTLRDVEAITINGLAAATGQTRISGKKGTRDFRLIAIRADADSVYRFLFVTPPELTASLGEALRRTTYSFRRLSPEEAAEIKPLRLRLHRVRSGDTPSSIARRMAFENHRLQRFLVLNGLNERSSIRPGQVLKIVTEE
jgi:predicted Zn-dependent protease